VRGEPEHDALSSSESAPQDSAKFAHSRHDKLSCTTCHGTSSGHGDLKSSVARDCQGCHHGTRTIVRDCAQCHTPAELRAPRPVPMPFALGVLAEARSRSTPFAHERHAGLECATCHADTRQKTVERPCASCHADHHTPDRNCASCHPDSRGTHTRAVHATGCGASGCHDRERSAAVTPVRATCLACHGEQRDHQAGRECATCHLSAWTGAAAGRS
jgi:hypothetical protein